MTSVTKVSCNRSFEGHQYVFSHHSSELKCEMKFAIYLPPQAESGDVPVIYWLSGLTCNELNFVQKAGAQKYAAKHGIAVVCPDTSPRGCNIPGEADKWDFGVGAGFYVDATQAPWDKNFRMYTYVTKELPEVIADKFPVDPKRQSIMGHSMGGHGALICALKNPYKYASVSAFSPICNPSVSPWGKNALSGYLGSDTDAWKQYDATCLVSAYDGPVIDILIDQGADDEYIKAGELLPENFMNACKNALVPAVLKMREGYDHSYFYVASFIEEHFEFHAKHLKN
ncbi:S-formylglutathione hydrolase-like [Macrosteles quadrilineatus]|uniref:S-formylglutathione hydrolase-like n=1 Tax=Macrosteles quadrilineatus TaxID=74068 RepID=UPI0023E17778|nr:S-formylglutathione hydrolase-like [Macrosteles quadrilineatus]XP_054271325.1 S-formylglutathione hydrolase-like [Macrosteles quadrilineatus]XP_054271535.1 S-formylglutathione hydrolase-like [Macrosteles quadrilineatus]XP_054271537.1 S-formylglutathione hydrolase-like [Macrosteles quadrilineatus]